MPLPTSYTEETLAQFMVTELRSTADDLGWAVGDLEEAVNDAIILYGATDIASCTDVSKLRAVARVAVWEAAVKDTVPATDSSADGYQNSDSQVHDHCVAMLVRATNAADVWLPQSRRFATSACIEYVF